MLLLFWVGPGSRALFLPVFRQSSGERPFCSSQRSGASCYSVVPPEVAVLSLPDSVRCSCSEATLFPASAGSCLARRVVPPRAPLLLCCPRRALPWEGPRRSPQPKCGPEPRRGRVQARGSGGVGCPGAASPVSVPRPLCSLQVPCWALATASFTVE